MGPCPLPDPGHTDQRERGSGQYRPTKLGEAYTDKARIAEMEAGFVLAVPSGHVELVLPKTTAFEIEAGILTGWLQDD